MERVPINTSKIESSHPFPHLFTKNKDRVILPHHFNDSTLYGGCGGNKELSKKMTKKMKEILARNSGRIQVRGERSKKDERNFSPKFREGSSTSWERPFLLAGWGGRIMMIRTRSPADTFIFCSRYIFLCCTFDTASSFWAVALLMHHLLLCIFCISVTFCSVPSVSACDRRCRLW